MTDEERLQMLAEQLIIVRDNLFRGMSKSIQKLQARSINEVLGLENFIQSPKRELVGLTDEDFLDWYDNTHWGNEDFKQGCGRAFEAGWQLAHGIKGEA